MLKLKTYYKSSGMHVSSSICASVNYFDRLTGSDLDALHDRMRAELGEHVIVDGSDDWGSKPEHRPEVFVAAFAKEQGRTPLAYYHSGISGVTKSGVVIKPEDFDALTEWYQAKYGVEIDKTPHLKLTFHSNSTAC